MRSNQLSYLAIIFLIDAAKVEVIFILCNIFPKKNRRKIKPSQLIG